MQRWVKLYEKFTEWEWFGNSQMVHVFIYLFLRANTATETYRGIEVRRGQLITTLSKIAADTHLSRMAVRVCLKKLLTTGEIKQESTSKHTVITICNYERYQQPSAPAPQQKPAKEAAASKPTPQPIATPIEEQHPERTYKEQMLADDYWMEVMCMRHHFANRALLADYISRFWLDAACRGKAHSDLRDAKNHFNSWLLIILKNEQNLKNNEKSNAQRRGFEVTATSAKDYKTAF
jgi:hypothetical protein